MKIINLKTFITYGILLSLIQPLCGQEVVKRNINQNITNDSIIIQKSISKVVDSATAYVSFVVNTSGEISKVKAFRIICKKCSKESKKIIKEEAMKEVSYLIPDLNSFPMEVKFKMQVKFTLMEGFNKNPSENIIIKRPNAQQRTELKSK